MGAAEVKQFLTCAPYDKLAGFGRKTRSGIPRSGWSGNVETASEDDGPGIAERPSTPSDRACLTVRCHASESSSPLRGAFGVKHLDERARAAINELLKGYRYQSTPTGMGRVRPAQRRGHDRGGVTSPDPRCRC